MGIRPIAGSSGKGGRSTPSNPRQDYGTSLEALSDKEVAVTLNTWTFQSDKAATITMLEKHISPYLEWVWENKTKFQLDAYEKPIIQWHNTHTCQTPF